MNKKTEDCGFNESPTIKMPPDTNLMERSKIKFDIPTLEFIKKTTKEIQN